MSKLDPVFDLMALFSGRDMGSVVIEKGDFRLALKQGQGLPSRPSQEPDLAPVQEGDIRPSSVQLEENEDLSQEERAQAIRKEVQSFLEDVYSPAVGFYHPAQLYVKGAGSDGEPIRVGSYIEKGQGLGFVSVLGEKLQVSAPVSGTIRQVNFKENDFVQYKDLLFVIEKVGDDHVS
ncbi:MAG: biotin/lipoyl-binding protein [Tissierellia bacterium]|nr:biotin/lipoyl-binding protein [Tissierellia bacterium]